jgi:hypothetical protein
LFDARAEFPPPERREAGMAKGRAVAIVLDDMQKAALTELANPRCMST